MTQAEQETGQQDWAPTTAAKGGTPGQAGDDDREGRVMDGADDSMVPGEPADSAAADFVVGRTGDVRDVRDEAPAVTPAAAPDVEDAHADLGEAPADLLAAREREDVTAMWHEIQARFVDEPRTAIEDADALVADLLQRVTRTLNHERERLAQAWSDEGSASTEDLRQGLRHYRVLFERLISA